MHLGGKQRYGGGAGQKEDGRVGGGLVTKKQPALVYFSGYLPENLFKNPIMTDHEGCQSDVPGPTSAGTYCEPSHPCAPLPGF